MALSLSLISEIVLVLAAILNAGFILPVYQKLKDSERTNMASFQLNAEDTLKDFKIFFAITVVFTVATTSVIFGNLLDIAVLLTVGNILSMISSFLPLYIFYRWWRRFK